MTLVNFQDKLKKVHKNLYVKTDERSKNGADFWLSGIYFKQDTRVGLRYGADNARVHTDQQKYLQALSSGELDTFVVGICLNHVPEYDVFDLIKGCLLVPGWRKIALRIVKKKICTIEQVRKAFDCTGLGTTTYDNLNFFGRLNLAQDLGKGEAINA